MLEPVGDETQNPKICTDIESFSDTYFFQDKSETCFTTKFLAVTWQLYRFTCHSLTDYKSLLKNTTKEHSERLVTLETCYQSDEETWPDKQKDKYKDNDNDKHKHNTPPTRLLSCHSLSSYIVFTINPVIQTDTYKA